MVFMMMVITCSETKSSRVSFGVGYKATPPQPPNLLGHIRALPSVKRPPLIFIFLSPYTHQVLWREIHKWGEKWNGN